MNLYIGDYTRVKKGRVIRITKIKYNGEGNFIERNLHESKDLSSYSSYENLSLWDISLYVIGNLNKMNEVAKYNHLF